MKLVNYIPEACTFRENKSFLEAFPFNFWKEVNISQRRQWHPTPVLLPGKSHGWRSLVIHGISDGWTRLNDFTFTFPFDALEKEMASYSSVLAWRIPGMEEPWWAALYGVAQSRTRLKRCSSSGKTAFRNLSYERARKHPLVPSFCLSAAWNLDTAILDHGVKAMYGIIR